MPLALLFPLLFLMMSYHKREVEICLSSKGVSHSFNNLVKVSEGAIMFFRLKNLQLGIKRCSDNSPCRRVSCHTRLHTDFIQFLSMPWHHWRRNLWTFCPNTRLCGCRGGICDGDNHCNPECSGRISCLLGVHCGWHRSPYLTGLQLKTCYTVSDCPLPPIFHLSSLLSHWHTLTLTQWHAHAQSHRLLLFTHHTITGCNNCHLCSLPTPGRWLALDGQNHCIVYLSLQQPLPKGGELGGLCSWHVCTFQSLQRRFGAPDMLFCFVVLCASLN